MQRVSSNFTIFFKLFIPTGWTVFFTAFTASLFLMDESDLPFLTSDYFKYPFLIVFLLFFALMYFTIMKLKRVEMGEDCYYVSNYFKTYRLIYDDISSVNVIPLGRLNLTTFRLKSKGSFGKKIHFLGSKNLFEMFMKSNPDVKSLFENKMKVKATS